MVAIRNIAIARPALAAAIGVHLLLSCPAFAQQGEKKITLNEVKASGVLTSNYLKERQTPPIQKAPTPNLNDFQEHISPILQETCVDCHGPDTQEGNIRIDTLDPNLFTGSDVDWWLEILAVLTNGEMPPPDEGEISTEHRNKVIEWLSLELQHASVARRSKGGHSSFRRLTRDEYNYTLQDLLGLPFDFAKNLPPESVSEDGFKNSSEMLHMSAMQFDTYRETARAALNLATVRGERPPHLYWGVSMHTASVKTWAKQDEEEKKLREKHQDDPEKLSKALERHAASIRRPHGQTYYKDETTGRTGRAQWSYGGARYASEPTDLRPPIPTTQKVVAVIPRQQKLIVELGDRIPEEGTLRVRARASRMSSDGPVPYLQLEFGWQASNDSHASVRVSKKDVPIEAKPGEPQFYQWDIPLSEVYPRNSVRHISQMGDLPSPSEYIKFVNAADSLCEVQIDYVEVTAPVYDQWPPTSHSRIFFDSRHSHIPTNESAYANEILRKFLPRVWRRSVTDQEVNQKLALLETIRPTCESFEDAMIEVLATALSSPKFLYLSNTDSANRDGSPSRFQFELATRLSTFLWCSTPDEKLYRLAANGKLDDPAVVAAQVDRMLNDARAERFSEQFVRQWLGMQLLDYLDVDRKLFPHFDDTLKRAMQREPIEFFHYLLTENKSVLDFLHADYTMVNERLARHYGLHNVSGNHFRRVDLGPEHSRGGLLTQPGLLAMNSDGIDSHPLKRGIWMLENLLNDPPPPPPPAVPEIDLADPEIAKLTLKQRIEDHRNDPACMSCHAKIDPWGIAFEDFDAVGSFRKQAKGKAVDSTSQLFNGEKLAGIDGLKRYLLTNRQDQFVRAMVYKMTTYALGRPLTFADRSSIDKITAAVRKQGDGLNTMVRLIVLSDLFSQMELRDDK